MNRITIISLIAFFLGLSAQAGLGFEFDKNRFKQSTFQCTTDAECNYGKCTTGHCVCNDGFRDSTEAACDHAMQDLDKTAAWALEAALGWVFPAGWLYNGIWPTALARLAVEGTAIGMTFGYFWERDRYLNELRKENFKALGYFIGSTLFGGLHLGAWIFSAYFLSWFDIAHSSHLKSWNKDKGPADLVVLADKIRDSIRITQNKFGASDCAVVEECVGGLGERRLLRFDAYITNIGLSDFVMGLEEVKPVWSPCHQHFHGPDTAKYFVEHHLKDSNNNTLQIIRRGHKQGYCYIDSTNINSSYSGKFDCGSPHFTMQLTQGITAGWSDIYDSNTDCQWIDITNLPSGNYSLQVSVNPKGIYYQDEDLTNNLSILNVEIPDVDKTKERAHYGIPVSSTIVSGPRS